MDPGNRLTKDDAQLASGQIKRENSSNGVSQTGQFEHSVSRSPSQQPIPSTEPNDSMAATGPKKKGTAAAAKKPVKRSKPSGPSKKTLKKAKADLNGKGPNAAVDDDDDDGSDSGPYCLCRGPDDHRWMIFCETCEDWFHGECVDLTKEIGESLLERFVCPNCTTDAFHSLYKKTCAFGSCRKAARASQRAAQSVFCSNEHAQMWWEKMIAQLPKGTATPALSDHLTQDEFMAYLSGITPTVSEEGVLKLVKSPFHGRTSNGDTSTKSDNEDLLQVLTEEEKQFLANAATARYHLGEETLLCHKMLALVDLAADHRRSTITAGHFDESVCGYNQRLDTVSARDAFASFVKSPEGEAIFAAKDILAPEGSSSAAAVADINSAESGIMCKKKKCKVHAGWQKMMVLGIKYQIKELANQAEEISEEERAVREAAAERWRRKQAENNWVEVIEG